MSGYNRGPNVSQYVANLNTIPHTAGAAPQEDLAFDDNDLALFTNTELFNFDLGDVKHQEYSQGDGKLPVKAAGKQDNIDYGDAGFNVFDPSQSLPPINTNFANNNFDPQLFHSPPQSATYPTQTQPMSAASPDAQQVAGQKRAHSSASPAASVEDVARMAAEEDKRRRNTAASARFRVKKKQREAALEKSAKENADKVDALQKRVDELEMENKWLRNIVVEKEGKTIKEEGASRSSEHTVPASISSKSSKKGVGTQSA